jgi:hypothetical protein
LNRDTQSMRTVSSVALLAVALTACGCGGQGHTTGSASVKQAPLEAVAYHLRCPISDAHHESSPDPATARVLVPARPTGALICRYWGRHDSGREGSFAGSRSVADTADLKRMVARLDALPPVPPRRIGHRIPSCPVFGDRSELIFFRYRHASDDPVRIFVDCDVPVSNGRIVMRGLGLGVALGEVHWPDEGLL